MSLLFCALMLTNLVPTAHADTIFLPIVQSDSEQQIDAAASISVVAQLVSGANPLRVAKQSKVQFSGGLPALSLYRFESNNQSAIQSLTKHKSVIAVNYSDDLSGFEAQQRTFDAYGDDFTALQHYFSFRRGETDPMNTTGSVEQALVVDNVEPFAQEWRTWGLLTASASAAQSMVTGKDVTVAVLDTGVDLDHPLLAGRLVPGFDYVEMDDRPDDIGDGSDHDSDGFVDEAVGHGTHVAGVIASVAPQVNLMPVRVLHSDGGGELFDIVQGIAFAVEHGADVINLSFSAKQHSATLEAAIRYALSHQVVVVAAAAVGNEGQLLPPANYDGVIAVGAIQKDGYVAGFSESYAGLVDVFAPGEMIYSTYANGDYAWWSGSSMAAPFVAGEAALLIEAGGCIPDCIFDAITKEVTGLRPNAGIIHIQKAVQNVKKYVSVCLLAVNDKGLDTGISSIHQVAAQHGVTSDFLLNADRTSQSGNPALRWNEFFAGDEVLLPTGQIGAEGWFALPPSIAYADDRTTNLSYEEWIDSFVAGALPQEQLDKVLNVLPLRAHELEHLVGKSCVAVAHKGISVNYGPLNASLQGDRYGLFSFTILGLAPAGSIPESGSSDSLPVLRIRIESPLTPTQGHNLFYHH